MTRAADDTVLFVSSLLLPPTVLSCFGFTPSFFLLVNAIALIVTVGDKLLAKLGANRVRERDLCLLALLGGWPAAGLGFWSVRHKTRKQSFLLRFGCAACVNLLLCSWALLW